MLVEDVEKLQPLIDEFVKKWNELWEFVGKAMDAICVAWEEVVFEIQEKFPVCRNQRYAIAKKISRCTSMEAKTVYRVLKPIYYARGSC